MFVMLLRIVTHMTLIMVHQFLETKADSLGQNYLQVPNIYSYVPSPMVYVSTQTPLFIDICNYRLHKMMTDDTLIYRKNGLISIA